MAIDRIVSRDKVTTKASTTLNTFVWQQYAKFKFLNLLAGISLVIPLLGFADCSNQAVVIRYRLSSCPAVDLKYPSELRGATFEGRLKHEFRYHDNSQMECRKLTRYSMKQKLIVSDTWGTFENYVGWIKEDSGTCSLIFSSFEKGPPNYRPVAEKSKTAKYFSEPFLNALLPSLHLDIDKNSEEINFFTSIPEFQKWCESIKIDPPLSL